MGQECSLAECTAIEPKVVSPKYNKIKKNITNIERKNIINDIETKKINKSIKYKSKYDILYEFNDYLINQDFKTALKLVKHYKSIDFTCHYMSNGDTCLHYGVRLNNTKFIQYLLYKGFNVDLRSELTLETPLHVAVKCELINVIKILLSYGCDINAKNILGKTPLDIAYDIKNVDVILLLNPKYIPINNNISNTSDDIIAVPELQKTSTHQDVYNEMVPELPKPCPRHVGGSTIEGIDVNKLIEPKNISIADQDFVYITDYEKYANQLSDHDMVSSISVNTKNMLLNDVNTGETEYDSDTSFVTEKELLPKLGDFLKKYRKKLNEYESRYLFIKDGYLIWHDNKIDFNVRDKLMPSESKLYKGCLNLLRIKGINALNDNTFEIKAINIKNGKIKKDKIYQWQCSSIEQRNNWINGIRQYCVHLNINIDNI